MPLYDYDCEKCEASFEFFRGFNDPEPETCPHCGKGPIKRRLSLPSIVFKGGGFYKNDSRGNRPEPAPAAKPDQSESDKPKQPVAEKETPVEKKEKTEKSETKASVKKE